MRVTARKISQILVALFLTLISIETLVSFFFGGERVWHRSLVVLALTCAVWGISEGILYLYIKYAPSRLPVSTLQLHVDDVKKRDGDAAPLGQ